jgi:hypothetical protein
MPDADAVAGHQDGGRHERHHQDVRAQPATELDGMLDILLHGLLTDPAA